MKVLVTGNEGYIGSVITESLLALNYEVIGYDTGFYNDCSLVEYHPRIKQINKDVRSVTVDDLRSIDAIIYLAALSNDPLGELNPNLTFKINHEAVVNFAKLAKHAKVKRFIYASSQSMYGISDSEDELDEDISEKNPLTAYAKTKWDAEEDLKKLANDDFIITCFRPSTVFGSSPKLRTDIVFNNLVACAYTTGKIEIKSDGTPWRPVVHIQDVSSAFIAGLKAPAELIQKQGFNVGFENGNFTVRQLAEVAQSVVPGCSLTFTHEHNADSRTYRVSFNKILTILREYYSPQWDLLRGGKDLVELLKKSGFTEEDFRGRKTIRLKTITYLMNHNLLDSNLYWIN